jgi:hypothetical protein
MREIECKEVHCVFKKLRDPQGCGIIRARIGVKNESQPSKELIVFFILSFIDDMEVKLHAWSYVILFSVVKNRDGEPFFRWKLRTLEN